MNHPIASKIPGILKAVAGKPDARARRNSKTDAASSSQGRLKDVYFGGLMVGVAGKLAGTDKSQESWEFSESESESWSDHEKEVTGKTVASRNSESSEILKLEAEKWPHHFHSPVVVPHMKKVYSIVRQNYGRSPTDDLGQDYMENLRFAKNQLLKSLKELFRVTEKLIKDQREITGLTTVDYKQATCGDRRLCHVIKLLSLRMPKPTSSHQVWEVSVTNQSKPGKTKLDGIWELAISKI